MKGSLHALCEGNVSNELVRLWDPRCWSWRSVCCNLKLRRLHRDWERHRIESAAGRLQMGDEMAGNVWVFSPRWCKVMLFQVTTNRKNMASTVRRIWHFLFEVAIFIIFQRHAHQYIHIQSAPLCFCQSVDLNSVLKCSVSDLIAAPWHLIHVFFFFCLCCH